MPATEPRCLRVLDHSVLPQLWFDGLDKCEMRYHRSDRQYFSLRGETSVVETSRLVLPPLLLFGYLHVRSATCNIDMTITNKEETRPTDVSTRRCVRKRVSRPLSSHFETNCPNILPTYQANSRASHGAEEFGTTPHFGSKPLAVPPVWKGGGVVHLVLWRNGILVSPARHYLPTSSDTTMMVLKVEQQPRITQPPTAAYLLYIGSYLVSSDHHVFPTSPLGEHGSREVIQVSRYPVTRSLSRSVDSHCSPPHTTHF